MRAQLVAAAVVWLVGTAILLSRGVLYVVAPEEYERFGYGIVLIALVAIAIGIVKARFILIGYAAKAVTRIRTRGHACFFGLFAWSSWVFIIVMMGGGMLLRHSPLVDCVVGADVPRHPLRRRRHRPRHRRRGLLARRPGLRRGARTARRGGAELETPDREAPSA